MSATLDPIWNGEALPGVYRFNARCSADEVCAEVTARGWRCFLLDGSVIDDKASFLQECAASMQFPAYFGHNWDAFFDSLTDLSWAGAPGYIVLYDHPQHFTEQYPDEWVTAHDIFVQAATFWRSRGVPFYVLLRR